LASRKILSFQAPSHPEPDSSPSCKQHPPNLRSGRFKATDKLIESLKSLSVMQSKNRSK